jgi:hypothetical protein
MTKYLSILIVTISFSLNAQNEKNKLIHKDSTNELYMINSASEDNFWSLKVCVESWNCKGFITEKDTSSTPYEKMNVRAIITVISNFQYKIEYKWRDSYKFLVDTFNIYCSDGVFSIALTTGNSIKGNISDYLNMIDFMPTSSDQRDVVFVSTRDEKIIFYEKFK